LLAFLISETEKTSLLRLSRFSCYFPSGAGEVSVLLLLEAILLAKKPPFTTEGDRPGYHSSYVSSIAGLFAYGRLMKKRTA